jgi:hypothetical protein
MNMKRRVFIAGALALPFLATPKIVEARTAQRVRVTFPLLFQPGDGQTYQSQGQLRTPIGDKMEQAVQAVLAANPHLRYDLSQKVSFDLQDSKGRPWGPPGRVKLPGTNVFKKGRPWTAPRNAIMAKSLGVGLKGGDAPNVNDLARVVVRARFQVAQA